MENIRESAPQSACHIVGAQLVLAESEAFIVIRLGPGFAGQGLDRSRCAPSLPCMPIIWDFTFSKIP